MRVRTSTAPRRLPSASVVACAVLVGGCSGTTAPTGAPAEPGTTVPSSTPTRSPSSQPTAPRTRRTPRQDRPPRDTVGTASPRQVVGLVRIVASIGDDGRGETSTGMVLRDDGQVVTNNHAVAGATAVQATVMTTGRTYSARVVGADPGHDVALLHLDGASGLRRVSLASRAAQVGDRVTAVGDARGLRSTFTAATGTLLARGRTLVTPATSTLPSERLTGVLLSSCDVVTGESGGPTYDVRGHVIGMTTAAVRTRDGLFGVAIPLSTFRSVVRRLERRSTT